MKILICSEFYYPKIGGVEQHNYHLANFLQEKGHEVEVVTTFLEKRPFKINSVKINQFKIKGNMVKGFTGDTSKYQSFLKNTKFDIIFINAAQQWTLDLMLPIIKEIKGKKIIFPCGFSRFKNILYLPYYYILKKYINNFDAVICASKKMQDYFFIKKNFKKKIFIVENGSTLNKPIYSLEKFREKYDVKNYDKIICNISNFKFFKGQDRSISLLRKIKEKNIKLFLIGNTMSILYFYFLKLFVFFFNKSQRNKKIIVLSTSREEAMTILQYSNIFLFTSRLEYDPLVIKEAILASIKFVSFDVGTVKSYAKLGLGFCSNDKKKLLSKLTSYILNNEAKSSSKFSLIKKDYNWKSILPKYVKIFENL
jgi:glycosyltransferase involved in cell wall biosynthesis